MNEMNRKKLYIWKLATFLRAHGMIMSVQELAAQLNRNQFRTTYDSEYAGERGTYTLVNKAYQWVHDELGLPEEASAIADAFVKQDSTHAWDKE